MHKYLPRVHLVPAADAALPVITREQIEASTTFVFPETAFITVTAYQNQRVSWRLDFKLPAQHHKSWKSTYGQSLYNVLYVVFKY